MEMTSGLTFGNTGVGAPQVEVPETRVYRSADGTVSRRYRAGDLVTRAEYDWLKMAPQEELGELDEGELTFGEASALDSESPPPTLPPGAIQDPEGYAKALADGVIQAIDPESDEAKVDPDAPTPIVEPEAKAEPAPRNKAEPAPKNKAG